MYTLRVFTLLTVSAAISFSTLNAQAAPVNGQHNAQPKNGMEVRNGSFTVNKGATFNGNGTSESSAGLAATNARVVVQDGSFSDNYQCGINATKKSQLIINGGSIHRNYIGPLVQNGSKIVVNKGDFRNDISIYLANKSSAIINDGLLGGLYANNGLFAKDGSSATIRGGTFRDSGYGAEFYDAAPSVISSGYFTNNIYGVFLCSAKVTINGGLFEQNGHAGVTTTVHEGGAKSFLKINGGTFRYGIAAGCEVISRSITTINGGTFRENGYYGSELLIGSYPSTGGLRVASGGQATVNGGIFTQNEGAGVQAFLPDSFVTINGGDFRKNGRISPGGGYGAYIHSEAGAVINGGDFSDNLEGIQIGLPYTPFDWEYKPNSKVTVNGGKFYNSKNSIRVDSGSECEINGGDFNAFRTISASGFDSTVRITGGTFQSELFDFDASFGSTIELTGEFSGYGSGKQTVVITPATGQGSISGTLQGRLKNSKKAQSFKYRVTPFSKIILHVTGSPSSKASSSVNAS